jgi:CDP-glycerol glycerophosphotransferase
MPTESMAKGEPVELSIIVPIYNVEEFLIECLDSIDAQEGVDFEVILVDDGSTDTSGDMAEEYARTHPRFTCYHKENGGLSDARNYGIARAQGEFICFLDSDDVIVPGIYRDMLAAARRDGSDVVSCNVARMTSQKRKSCLPWNIQVTFSVILT